MGKNKYYTESTTLSAFKRLMSARESKLERRAFCKYVAETYDITYARIVRIVLNGRYEEWQWRGIVGCVADFTGDSSIDTPEKAYGWWDSLLRYNIPQSDGSPMQPVKKPFYEFMRSRGAARPMLSRRMRDHEFRDYEMVGIESIFAAYVKQSASDKS